MNVAFFSKFYPKIWVGFYLNTGEHFLRGFILKSTKRAQVFLKNGTRDFQNSPPFVRSACFYVTISGNFKRFQYCSFEKDFLENENLSSKNWGTVFQLKALRLQMNYFHQEYQRASILNDEYKSGSITKNGGLPVTTFFLKLFFSLSTYKELFRCISDPNAHCKHWSFI